MGHGWEVGQRVVPIYVSVILMLLGRALGFGMVSLAVYAVVVAIGFHLRVVWQVYQHSMHRWDRARAVSLGDAGWHLIRTAHRKEIAWRSRRA